MNGEFTFLAEALKKAALVIADGMHGEIQIGNLKITLKTRTRDGRVKVDFSVVPFTPVIDVPANDENKSE